MKKASRCADDYVRIRSNGAELVFQIITTDNEHSTKVSSTAQFFHNFQCL